MHNTPAPIALAMLTFSAKIDYVKISTPGHIPLPELQGRPVWARKTGCNRLTIHDLTPDDLACLSPLLGNATLIELEVAVDARTGDVPVERREELLRRVMVDLFARQLDPSGGPAMVNEFRAFYRRLGAGAIVRPFNRRLPSATDQQLHGGRQDGAQVKCYLKRRDQGQALHARVHSARVEVRLGGTGLAENGLEVLKDLDGFKFRRLLLPYFRHVSSPERRRRTVSPEVQGLAEALRAAAGRIDLQDWQGAGVGAFQRGGSRHSDAVRLRRNTQVNKRIGEALGRLESQFQLTKSVRARHLPWDKRPTVARVCDDPTQSAMTN